MGALPPLMHLDPRTLGAAVLAGVALALAAPSLPAAREFAAWWARPLMLPFVWQALGEASAAGDHAEAFARGQQILQLLPTWTDGHAVFAYRFALDGERELRGAAAAAAAERRLHVALAWMDSARGAAGRRELELLQAMASLPDIACRRYPGLAERLRAQGGAASIAEAWLAEAERLFPTAPVREQRTFHAPLLAAALLHAGQRTAALAVLDAAIERSFDVRDAELAAEWRARLIEARRFLGGDSTVDLAAVHADPRLAALEPFLR